MIEFYYKSDLLNDPLITDEHILLLKLAKKQHLNKIKKISFKVNNLLVKYFKKINIVLIDYKLEFGTLNNKIVLADEISPDSCRLWDNKTKVKL